MSLEEKVLMNETKKQMKLLVSEMMKDYTIDNIVFGELKSIPVKSLFGCSVKYIYPNSYCILYNRFTMVRLRVEYKEVQRYLKRRRDYYDRVNNSLISNSN